MYVSVTAKENKERYNEGKSISLSGDGQVSLDTDGDTLEVTVRIEDEQTLVRGERGFALRRVMKRRAFVVLREREVLEIAQKVTQAVLQRRMRTAKKAAA